MTNQLTYNPEIYKNLSLVLTAEKNAAPHLDSVSDMGKIICKYDMQEYFGICLLHKHFDISDDEILVRTFAENKAFTQPQKVEKTSNVLSTLWTYSQTNDSVPFSLEFTDGQFFDDELQKVRHQLLNDKNFHQEISEYLTIKGLKDIFGLILLETKFNIKYEQDSEMLLETTLNADKISVLTPTLKSEVKKLNTVETQWHFDPTSENFTDCGRPCHTSCHSDDYDA